MNFTRNIIYILNENKEFDLWKSQMDNKSLEELSHYIQTLYNKADKFNSKNFDIKSKEYLDLLKKIEYVESKLHIHRKRGRILR